MEYRKFARGKRNESFSVLGVGMGGIQNAREQEIEAVVSKAIDCGINFFDLCGGGSRIYAPFGRAIAGRRESVYFQMHFGAVYNDKGEYGWSRDAARIRETFEWELESTGAGYADFGFLHCVDTQEDIAALNNAGVVDYIAELKRQGLVRYIGFSSHTPSVAQSLLDAGLADMMMFSINPAYDFEQGDEYGIGSVSERTALFRRCAAEGVGISVMKPFHGGRLLDAAVSPFGAALTRYQCLQYALDRPAVLTVLPGVRGIEDMEALLGFCGASAEEKDYSAIARFTAGKSDGSCVYCNHCLPCPAGIDVGLVNKYYDLALAGDRMAEGHYAKLSVGAGACLGCGHCDRRCPFGVKQSMRMREIAARFGSLAGL